MISLATRSRGGSISGTIVIAGSLAQRPGIGGHTWVFLQYLLGLRRLGWDVLFVDRLEAGMCEDAKGQRCSIESSINLRYFQETMERFGLADSYTLLCDGGTRCIGVPRAEIQARTRDSALLLNVMGFLDDEEILAAAPRRVFLDIDPGFGQMWRELGLADVFAGHDAYVTIGENIGQPECGVPMCGLDWITTPQPVVLDYWPAHPPVSAGSFTSVAAWRGAYGPVEYQGRSYGLRVHEFRKFVELPQRSRSRFEVALNIHASEVSDLAILDAYGWSRVDPRAVAGDPWAYQEYIRDSLAEFMVAKNMYVQTRSGWLSDRSLCYLASGRPVLAQDTGFSDRYPTGEGLLTFTTLDEALAGVVELARDHRRHARAARAIAEEYFDSDHVLRRLLGALGVN